MLTSQYSYFLIRVCKVKAQPHIYKYIYKFNILFTTGRTDLGLDNSPSSGLDLLADCSGVGFLASYHGPTKLCDDVQLVQ